MSCHWDVILQTYFHLQIRDASNVPIIFSEDLTLFPQHLSHFMLLLRCQVGKVDRWVPELFLTLYSIYSVQPANYSSFL